MQTVLDLNNLTDPNQIQEGKSIEVPWPTATVDPNAVPTATATGAESSSLEDGTLIASGDITRDAAGVRVRATVTLQAGVTWHTVSGEENIITIAVEYGATLRILSELNPEIAFSQCDFGIGSGGPGCTVLLYPGQEVRVPAPTVTPTIQPTASGSETPTPTATPTYNIPTALSPSDNAFFNKDDLVTLRWLGTGALNADEAYLVRVEDLTSKQVYTAMTQALLFILPADWQSQKNDRHDYTWTIGVVKQSQPDKPSFCHCTTPIYVAGAGKWNIMRNLRLVGLICVGVLMVGCSSAPQGGVTPTVEAIIATSTEIPTITLTASPSLVQEPIQQVDVGTSTPTATAAPPTETFTPSPTPGPYEYTIKAGDTLGYIVGYLGYTDLSTAPGSIIDQVVRLNDTIQSADILPGPGTVILIPRQTATPLPENTETAEAIESTAASAPNIPTASSITQYVVQPGDTIIGIAQNFNITIAQIVVLNPDLEVSSCNFEIPSGGEGCNITLKVGQVLNLPAPTPTPTLSPTPSGNETATPTATFVAPVVIFPPDGAAAGAGVFSLQWVGVGVLEPDEVYLIQLTDVTANKILLQAVTRNTSYALPDSLIPTDGQTHSISWMVWVAKPNADKVYGRVGGAPPEHIFSWASK